MDPFQEQQVNDIHNCCSALLTIINDCLDFAKIEAQKIELESVPFAVTDSVDSCLAVLSAEIRRRGQRVHYTVCNSVSSIVLGPAVRVKQIFLNILSNAVKFNRDGASLDIGVCACAVSSLTAACEDTLCQNCPHGALFDDCLAPDLRSGYVRRTTERHPGDSNSPAVLRCYVKDHGRGMTPEQVRNIFEPFVQARSVGSSQGLGLHGSETGTGLGLSIVRRLLDFMQGGCVVRSIAGVGSCFSVWVPVDLPCQGSPLRAISSNSKALLLSDDSQCRHCTGSLLKQCAEIVAVDVWDSAYDMDSSTKYSCVFLDVLPDSNLTDEYVDMIEKRLLCPGGKICLIVAESILETKNFRTRSGSQVISVFRPSTCSALRSVVEHSLVVPASHRRKSDDHSRSQEQVTILVVEDNKTNRAVLMQMLLALGIPQGDILEAHDGLQALAAIKKTPVDIVLMDIHMPRMSGWEAARRIRQNPLDYDAACIIALTAASTLSDRDESLKCMDFFVTKPLGMNSLSSVLTEACNKIGIRRTFKRVSRPSLPKQPSGTSLIETKPRHDWWSSEQEVAFSVFVLFLMLLCSCVGAR